MQDGSELEFTEILRGKLQTETLEGLRRFSGAAVGAAGVEPSVDLWFGLSSTPSEGFIFNC